MRSIGEAELVDIALGAAVLGAGGGGDPYVGRLLARAAIRKNGPVALIEASELTDHDRAVAVGMIGAPTVLNEKIPAGDEFARAVRKLEQRLGEEVTNIVAEEVGGINSMTPICAAAQLRVPLVDADLMGRAFPEIQMCLPTLSGIACTPMALSDDKGNGCIVDGVTNLWAERLARAVTIQMGCAAAMALYPMTGTQVQTSTILGSLSRAQRLGAAIRRARERHEDPTLRAVRELSGRVLLRGKVIDVARQIERGFTTAVVEIEGLGDDAGHTLHLSTQNEHLIASIDGDVVVTVPDLIIVLESESGTAVLTESLRYGLRVTVIAAPGDERWRTPMGLATTGPRYFGYDVDFRPIAA